MPKKHTIMSRFFTETSNAKEERRAQREGNIGKAIYYGYLKNSCKSGQISSKNKKDRDYYYFLGTSAFS
jgi:hypothetical protein